MCVARISFGVRFSLTQDTRSEGLLASFSQEFAAFFLRAFLAHWDLQCTWSCLHRLSVRLSNMGESVRIGQICFGSVEV